VPSWYYWRSLDLARNTSTGSKGLNRKENHEQALAALRKTIEAVAEAGFPNVIVMSGNREVKRDKPEGSSPGPNEVEATCQGSSNS